MHKKSLTDCQMFSDAACVQYASSWADVVVEGHYHGPGYMEPALRAAARDTKIPHGFLWKLRYRRSSIKLPPFQYMARLAEAYVEMRKAGAKARDPQADAVAAEFLKLAETLREFNSRLPREEAAGLRAAAQSLVPDSGEMGEEGRSMAGGGAQ